MSHEPRSNTLSSNEESGPRENGFIPETVKGTAVPTVPLFTPITSGSLLEPRHCLASLRNVGWTSWSHFCDVCACPTSTPCNHMLSLLTFEYFFLDLRRIRSRIPSTSLGHAALPDLLGACHDFLSGPPSYVETSKHATADWRITSSWIRSGLE